MDPIPSGYEAMDFSCCFSAHSRAGVDDFKLKRPMRLTLRLLMSYIYIYI
jgi:hypothetical protein